MRVHIFILKKTLKQALIIFADRYIIVLIIVHQETKWINKVFNTKNSSTHWHPLSVANIKIAELYSEL